MKKINNKVFITKTISPRIKMDSRLEFSNVAMLHKKNQLCNENCGEKMANFIRKLHSGMALWGESVKAEKKNQLCNEDCGGGKLYKEIQLWNCISQ